MNENMIATCGVFDIVHADHINLFKMMKRYDDLNRFSFFHVVVFLNSDKSVEENRGRPPLIPQKQRREVLEAIDWITAVHYFDEEHPHDIIRRHKPAVWAKGGDYDIEKMLSTPIVRSYGGKVITIPHKYGIHSEDIKREILERWMEKKC